MKIINNKLDKLMAGIDKSADIIASTMGACGNNVVLDKGFGAPDVTNDGVTIAGFIEWDDEQEQKGHEWLKEASERTNEEAGDGTSTTFTLGRALAKEGLASGLPSIAVYNSLVEAKDLVIEELKKLSKPVKSKEQLLNVATISSESKEIGQIVVDLLEDLGDNADVSVETSAIPGIEVEKEDGYTVKAGAIVAGMTPDGVLVKENSKCFVVTGKLMLWSELMPFIQKLEAKQIKDITLFCGDMDANLVNFFLLNKNLFNCTVICVRSQNDEVLEDIAIVTGATLVRRDQGQAIETLEPKVLGTAVKLTIDGSRTIIHKTNKKAARVKIQELRNRLKDEKNSNTFDLIENRISRLDNAVGVIRAGAPTESEQVYLKDKIVDAVNAVKSAKEEGIVAGGGLTLYQIARTLPDDTPGKRIMKKAVIYPMRHIIENAGLDPLEVISNMPNGKGFDVKKRQYVDMIKAGIIDPTKVERCALKNAVSFAGTLLTSKYSITNKKEKNEN